MRIYVDKKNIMQRILLILLFLNAIDLIGQDNQQIALANEYYQQAEFDKALPIFEKLAQNPQNINFIHNNYLQILQSKQLNQQAVKYLNKTISEFPTNLRYDVDLLDLYINLNDSSKAEKIYVALEAKVLANMGLLRTAAQYLINKQHQEFAERTYLAARKVLKDPKAFSIQLATLYRYANKKDKMVIEYLNYAEERPGNVRYVKNMLQLSLQESEDLESFVAMLMENIQANTNKELYSDLLIWANLQMRNFYGAFIQARAMDKRAKLPGNNSLEIGNLAYENDQLDIAEMIFSHVVEEFPDSKNYIDAKQMLIRTKETRIKRNFPVDTIAIRSLVKSYEQLLKQIGVSHYTLESYRQKALLQAFYLTESQVAIKILQEIIQYPNAQKDLVAQAKLDLGDIYVIIGEPWESVLLYYQVEKTHKNEHLGEEAKLRNAKLSFYKGNFDLAQEHLDILKNATRREIANDAMDLSILIKNNTILDSAQKALRAYAKVDLLLYQNRKFAANQLLDSMLIDYKEHPILDELLWLKSKILKEAGEYQAAIGLLHQIVFDMPYDILTDDALFDMALIYEELIQDNVKAQEYYQQLLTEYPGSIFVAEARKRFRTLRGDFVN